MIRGFRHKGLERLHNGSDHRGVDPKLAPRLARLLDALEAAAGPDDLDIAGWSLHPLKGERQGDWSLKVSGNWRLTFRFESGDILDVNLEDYH